MLLVMRLSHTLLITASHRWKVLEHYLPVMAGFHVRSPRRKFAGHRSKYIRERFRFRFRHQLSKFSVSSPTVKVFGFVTNGQSFRFRHQRTKPIVSIDGYWGVGKVSFTVWGGDTPLEIWCPPELNLLLRNMHIN